MPQKRPPRGVDLVQLVAEQVHVSKRLVQNRVKVTTVTDEHEQIIPQELLTESVRTECVSVNRVLELGEPIPQTRTNGDVTIIPVLEEIVVVEKRLVLKEEIHLHRERTTELVEHPVTLRKQRAIIEHLQDDGAIPIDPQEQSS